MRFFSQKFICCKLAIQFTIQKRAFLSIHLLAKVTGWAAFKSSRSVFKGRFVFVFMLLSLVASFLVSSELWTLYHDFCFVLNTSFGGSMLSFIVARRPPNPDRAVDFGPWRSSWRPPSCDSEVSSSSRWPYLWEIVIGSIVYDWFSFKYTGIG